MELASCSVIGDAVDTSGGLPGEAHTSASNRQRSMSLTTHARRRAARRNVAPDAVEYVLAYGRRVQRTGVTFYFLGRRDLPVADRRATWASRLEGTIVVEAQDGAVITVYRNRHGLRAIQRKMKHRIPELARHEPPPEDTQPNGYAALASA